MGFEYGDIPGYQGHEGGPNGEILHITLHATVSGTQKGGAVATAHYFQSANSGGLAHQVTDPGGTVRCAPDGLWTWHAPPNPHSLGRELCDMSSGDPARWLREPAHVQMLQHAAVQDAVWAEAHGLPLVFLSPGDLQASHKGFTTHANMSAAFHQSDHTDPGAGFPIHDYLEMVAKHLPSNHPTTKQPPSHPAHPTGDTTPGLPHWYHRDLHEGAQGADVKVVQTKLHKTGAYKGTIDGYFGPMLVAGVNIFKKNHKLNADGIVGRQAAIDLGA